MNTIQSIINSCLKLSKTERITKVCQLAVKENLGILNPIEAIEFATIQSIRESNGELEKIRKERKENKFYA
jgi:hypothetical protein